MEDRTRKLLIVLGIVALLTGGFYAYKYFFEKKPAPPKVMLTMKAPVPRKPGVPVKAPATAPGAKAVPAAAPAVPEKPVIRVVEKGKEVTYASPESLMSGTSLSPAELSALSQKKLADARAALDAAKKSGDKTAVARAEAEVKVAERLDLLVSAKLKEAPGKKTYVYSSLGKRDPFMNPLEIPKVYPPIPPDATPYQRVPVEGIRLKAIIWNEKGGRAMVVTPDNRAFTVKKGEKLGDKLGRITNITRNAVTVTEKIIDIMGNVETKVTVLKLKEAE